MKLKTIITASGIVSSSILVVSCTKATGKDVATEDRNFTNKALVQVFDATINSGNTHVFVDANQITGSALAYGGVFPASSYAFAVDPGPRAFSIRNTTAGTTQVPIIFSGNFEPGKNYTIFMYDTTTEAKQVTVLNNIVIPSDSTARVKFANFAWLKAGTAPGVDVFSKLRGSNVFSNVLPTEVTEYIPYAAAVNDSLIVRRAGTTEALDTAVFNFTRKRSYTLVYRGRAAFNEAGGATFPRIISAFANY